MADNETQVQAAALAQLKELLTNGADDEACVGVLSSVGWDVQKAADLIFGGSHPYPQPISTGSGAVGAGASSSSSSSSSTTSGSASAYRYPPVAASSGSGSSSREERREGWERFDVEDLGQGGGVRNGGANNHIASGPFQNPAGIPRTILTVLSFPLHIISGLFRFLFVLLRRVVILGGAGAGAGPIVPRVSLGSVGLALWGYVSGNNNSNNRDTAGTSARGRRRRGIMGNGWGRREGGPDRWIRELEEETGGVCLRQRATANASSTTTTTTTCGSSERKPNGLGLEFDGEDEMIMMRARSGRKYLPDFEVCTYEEMLKKCQREMKIGCVVLVSEEHDDVRPFKMETLLDEGLVKVLSENEILCWGGDVCDREAWSASEKLQATTYPFVAFVALQPGRNPGGSFMSSSSNSSSSTSAPPTLTVLSRHQGPSTNSGPTSASVLKGHIEATMLPRVRPYLEKLRSKQRERERDRELRAEQDRAFEEAKRRDKERIERKMKEERDREADRVREERRREEEKAEKATRERVRRWMKRWVEQQKKAGGGGGGVRIGIRFPSGKRAIERIETLTGLFAFVDSQFVAEEEDEGEKADIADEAALEEYVASHGSSSSFWGFRIATAYPRKDIRWSPGVRLEDVEELCAGAQVVVERDSVVDCDDDDDE